MKAAIFCLALLVAASIIESAPMEMSRDENVAMRQNGELAGGYL